MKTRNDTPSVFDRLMQKETAISKYIRHNLSALLNTRRFPALALDQSGNPDPALTRYGLSEMSAVNADDEIARNALLAVIAQQVSIFEPRLRQVKVFIPEKQPASRRRLELVIEAELHNAAERKILAFRSVLDLASCLIQLEEPYAERISCALS